MNYAQDANPVQRLERMGFSSDPIGSDRGIADRE
jgi:hypothetical protein